jgi:hypothetical protein
MPEDRQERPSADDGQEPATAGDSPDQEGQPAVEARQSRDDEQDPKPEGDLNADNQPSWGNVINHFHGYVSANSATFGIEGEAEQSGARGAPAEGRIEEREVSRVAGAYARPACYAKAESALIEDRVIIITGEAGTGRRAGGIYLLNRVLGGQRPIVGLSPAISVEMLSARPFDPGTGYLISDMFHEQGTAELTDFYWRKVCGKVRKANAYLVVTKGDGKRVARLDVVKHIPWQRPAAEDALRAHLGEETAQDETIAKLAEALGSQYQLADVVSIASRICAAGNVQDVVAGLEETDRIAVATWLDEPGRCMSAVLEVAALAFVVGVSERVFEAELAALKGRTDEFAPELDTTDEEVRAQVDLSFRPLRRLRSAHPLIDVRWRPDTRGRGPRPIRHIEFGVPAYREYVLAELWSRYPIEFWTAVRQWLHDVASGGGRDMQVHADLVYNAAIGLALLALVAPDEVDDCYLAPWTAPGSSVNQQAMAVYVVWQMSRIDQLAPLALHIAIDWASQSTRVRRSAAMYAFVGELGARFPLEAERRLSLLADRGEPGALPALAQLFATLAGQRTDAIVVLRELRHRLATGKDRRLADQVLRTINQVLLIQDMRDGRPAAVVFLTANPERVSDLAFLWAKTLSMRPWRNDALTAIEGALWAIEQASHDPEVVARLLGSAIGAELPPGERSMLCEDLLRRASATDQRDDPDDSDPSRHRVSAKLLDAFLDACMTTTTRELD